MSRQRIINTLRRLAPQRPGQTSKRTAAQIDAEIVRLHDAGRSQREIVAELGVSKGRIYRVLQARKGGVQFGECIRIQVRGLPQGVAG